MNVNDVLISVIVPIYNTEKYLKKCVDSILNQTHTNLEVILVNDGSSDHSLQLCKAYAKEDARVKVMDKENGGLSSARNAGLDACSGDYIMFVDSDDYLEADAVEHLVGIALKHKADIVTMKMKIVAEDYEPLDIYLDSSSIIVMSNNEYLSRILTREKPCSVCDKLFPFQFWRKRRFKVGVLNEDFLALSELLVDEECNVVEMDFHGYNYYTRNASISRNGFAQSSKDAVFNAEFLLEYMKVHKKDLIHYAGAYAAYQVRTALAIMSHEDFRNNEQFVHKCVDILITTRRYIWGSFMDIKDKFFCCFFPCAPVLCFRILKIIRR